MARPRQFNETQALKKAMDVFWLRGYSSAGMQELCDAMGINPGSLYAAFGSKQDLFLRAMRHYLEMVSREGIGEVDASVSGREGIRRYFNYVINGIMTGNRRFGCFGTNSFIEVGEHDTILKQMMTDHFRLLENAFQRALLRDGVASAASQARYLVCLAQGLNVLARTAPSQNTLNDIVATALASIGQSAVA